MTSKPTDDLLQRCRELLELNEKGESQQTALRALAATYDREIPAHDRRTMAVSQTHLEAMRALLSARPAESWQVEIDAYKREVRELEAVLRIPEKMEDDGFGPMFSALSKREFPPMTMYSHGTMIPDSRRSSRQVSSAQASPNTPIGRKSRRRRLISTMPKE
ncbi:hypothetical protein [Burkholderia pseudomallei]|uniref:hypothetical protein n=1 Tax=Burkholderia pseudomallei TaxID=28450 RepID=UPI0021F7C6CA|nr:hypothetical protein [Burkholderia pseudomallei]MCV9985203.1 hypothetical protein [Burkholderia pseudomallei]MCV9991515.1 hypothetical protein [Burkholderia pseudomallei]